jgi:hypothetical protein
MKSNLPDNYVEDPEQLFRKTRKNLKSIPSTSKSEDQKSRRNLLPEFEEMARTLRDFSVPTTENVRTGPAVDIGDNAFELKPSLINMVQASQFCGKPHEDASTHLQNFLEICSTFKTKDELLDAVLLRLFPFSLLGRAKQ